MKRVLIVDDEESIRWLLGRLLEMNGCRCTLAANASEGREHLKRNRFELVLSDVNMPGESGLEFLKFALSEYPDTVGIVMTANDGPDMEKKAYQAGACSHIIKPFTLNEVLIKVSKALGRLELGETARSDRRSKGTRRLLPRSTPKRLGCKRA